MHGSAQQAAALTQNQWSAEYADGPPAHVNCRCAIGLVLVQSAIATPEAGNAEVVADPNATPPSVLVPLLQRSAKDIADHIKQAVPATLAQDALEVDNYFFKLQGTRYQLQRARIDASMQYGFNSPEYINTYAKISPLASFHAGCDRNRRDAAGCVCAAWNLPGIAIA